MATRTTTTGSEVLIESHLVAAMLNLDEFPDSALAVAVPIVGALDVNQRTQAGLIVAPASGRPTLVARFRLRMAMSMALTWGIARFSLAASGLLHFNPRQRRADGSTCRVAFGVYR
jgi:hypothetical protein